VVEKVLNYQLVLNPDEKVKEVDENDEVVENYYRVKGAEVL